jgi:hypothetical protein
MRHLLTPVLSFLLMSDDFENYLGILLSTVCYKDLSCDSTVERQNGRQELQPLFGCIKTRAPRYHLYDIFQYSYIVGNIGILSYPVFSTD